MTKPAPSEIVNPPIEEPATPPTAPPVDPATPPTAPPVDPATPPSAAAPDAATLEEVSKRAMAEASNAAIPANVPAVPDATGAMVPMTPEIIAAWLAGNDITEEDQTDQLDYETALRILSAETPEAALSLDDVRAIKDLIGKQFIVVSLTWRKSTKSDDGKGRYAIMQCADADGVKFMASCGGTKVVLQLRKAQLAGWLPWQVEEPPRRRSPR